jgi:hypothetical protein
MVDITIDLEKLRNKGLFVGIPMYGGQCYGTTTKALMDLAVLCKEHNVLMKTYFLFNESLIPRARNYIVDEFLRSDCEYMIFIDADIRFNALDIFAMWHIMNEREDIDIFCGVYPKKAIAWEKVKNAVDQGFAEDDAKNLENYIGDYAFSPIAGTINIDEPAEVLESGTGFMLIKKQTLQKFQEFHPTYTYKPDHTRTENFNGDREIGLFFHCEIDPKSKRYLSEDYWFCQKAREAGLKTWIAPWVGLEHTGTYTFKGSLRHLAQIGEAVNVDPAKLKRKSK